jgi:hypothetical protein
VFFDNVKSALHDSTNKESFVNEIFHAMPILPEVKKLIESRVKNIHNVHLSPRVERSIAIFLMEEFPEGMIEIQKPVWYHWLESHCWFRMIRAHRHVTLDPYFVQPIGICRRCGYIQKYRSYNARTDQI